MLKVDKTLVGVDILRDGKLVGKDVNQSQIQHLVGDLPAKIVVTPVGGQGFLFGRGNQQIGPEVIRKVGRESIIVVSTPDKLRSLRSRRSWWIPVMPGVDALLAGYFTVTTGYKERTVYKVVS